MPPREPAGPAAATAPAQPDPAAPRLAALETRHFELAPQQELVGETQVLFARYENTFSAIGRQYNLGYEELRRANPGVDQWLPGEGTPIYLPTQTILPEAPHTGIVVNVPAMRLYYFTTEKGTTEKPATAGSPGSSRCRLTRSASAPKAGLRRSAKPKSCRKRKIPTWYVPASVRKEHAERGDPLPSIVPPGPDNPLGAYAMTLSLPGYLIHGTNKPAGVGMRSSHGCIRLYPEDIEALFGRVAARHGRAAREPARARGLATGASSISRFTRRSPRRRTTWSPRPMLLSTARSREPARLRRLSSSTARRSRRS